MIFESRFKFINAASSALHKMVDKNRLNSISLMYVKFTQNTVRLGGPYIFYLDRCDRNRKTRIYITYTTD